jgi:acetyl-CoA carboxylase biotin carboxyl carrier protein
MAAKDVRSEITGRVWKIEAQVERMLAVEDTILIIESMKMEIPVAAPVAGRLTRIHVAEGDVVDEGQVLATIEA